MATRFGNRFGKYIIDGRIAIGGMAEIFRAHTSSGQIVAIKKILPNYAAQPKFVQMFLDEARIVSPLQHGNIVQLYDFGKIENTYYLALEWIQGRPLSAIVQEQLARKIPFPIPAALLICIDICEGLNYAHARCDRFGRPLGIVHRDVSPPNILITHECVAKIADFGIAAATGRTTQTQPGVIRGKFSYMSPEQSRGGEIDHRSDIFSVGIVLYELLTGTRLFFRESETITIQAVRECKIPSMEAQRADISKDLVRIILKTLSQNPKQRPQTAGALAQELRRILQKEFPDQPRAIMAQFLRELFPKDIFASSGAEPLVLPAASIPWREKVASHPYLSSVIIGILAVALAEILARHNLR